MSDEAVSQFVAVTGCSAEQARFFLDASNGNVETALASYYEGGGAEDQEMDEHGHDDDGDRPAHPTTAQSGPLPGGGYTLSGSAPSHASEPAPVRSATPSSRPAAAASTGGPRVATLRDMNPSASSSSSSRSTGGGPRIGRLNHGGDDDDSGPSDNDKDPLEFFAGGGKSGLSVENPNAKKGGDEANSMIKGILQKAKEGGSRLAGLENAAPQQTRSTAFTGSAHTLGSDETPSTYIPAAQQGSSGPSRSRQAVPGGFPGGQQSEDDDFDDPNQPPTIRNLTFWEDGFSIEDSDLYRYDDPANNEVLAALNSGRAPLSLLKVKHDERVELRIAQRMNEKWTRQPKPPAGPFSGSGNRLGSDVSAVDDSLPSVTRPSASQPRQEPASMGTATVFEINQNEPTTTLQIRLRDGSRLSGRFNHTHTIGDVRRYINNSSPGAGSFDYVLQTTFPTRDLTDEKQTLKEAGLLGSLVVQRAA